MLEVLVSPGVDTVAVLVTLGTAAAVGRITNSTPLFVPAGMTLGRVQVIVCPEAVQVHPLPDPFLMKVRLVGRVSVMVTGPEVGPAPAAFVTSIQ